MALDSTNSLARFARSTENTVLHTTVLYGRSIQNFGDSMVPSGIRQGPCWGLGPAGAWALGPRSQFLFPTTFQPNAFQPFYCSMPTNRTAARRTGETQKSKFDILIDPLLSTVHLLELERYCAVCKNFKRHA